MCVYIHRSHLISACATSVLVCVPMLVCRYMQGCMSACLYVYVTMFVSVCICIHVCVSMYMCYICVRTCVCVWCGCVEDRKELELRGVCPRHLCIRSPRYTCTSV